MHPLPLVIFLTLAAGPNRPIPAGCREDHGTCREDCTIEYGGGTTKYRQLTECLVRCEQAQKECTDEHYLRLDAQFDPTPPPPEDPAMKPAQDSVRRGVYRASEAEPPTPVEPPEPAANEEPVAAPEPKSQPAAPAKPVSEPASKDSADDTSSDEPEPEPEPAPAPKPAPKPVEPTRPQPPPEPKKKDISDWDPNGD